MYIENQIETFLSYYDAEHDAGNMTAHDIRLLELIKSLFSRIEVLEADRMKRLTEAAFGSEIVVYHVDKESIIE